MPKAKVILQLSFSLLLAVSILWVLPRSIQAGRIETAKVNLKAENNASRPSWSPAATPVLVLYEITTPAPTSPLERTVRLLYFLVGGLVFLTIVLIIVVVLLLRKFRKY